MLYDFSSIAKFTSYDNQDTLNISIYLNTIYFNIFRDKRLYFKITISESIWFGIRSLFQSITTDHLRSSKIDELSLIKYSFDPSTKTSKPFMKFAIGKDPNINQYKPFYIKLQYSPKEYNQIFPMIYPNNIKVSSIHYTNMKFYYTKYIFCNKISRILPLSLDMESAQHRKSKYQHHNSQK